MFLDEKQSSFDVELNQKIAKKVKFSPIVKNINIFCQDEQEDPEDINVKFTRNMKTSIDDNDELRGLISSLNMNTGNQRETTLQWRTQVIIKIKR